MHTSMRRVYSHAKYDWAHLSTFCGKASLAQGMVTFLRKRANQKMTLKPTGARTCRSLIGMYSIPYMRWMPSVIDNFKHLLGPACASRYLSLKGFEMLTISSTCKTQS